MIVSITEDKNSRSLLILCTIWAFAGTTSNTWSYAFFGIFVGNKVNGKCCTIGTIVSSLADEADELVEDSESNGVAITIPFIRAQGMACATNDFTCLSSIVSLMFWDGTIVNPTKISTQTTMASRRRRGKSAILAEEDEHDETPARTLRFSDVMNTPSTPADTVASNGRDDDQADEDQDDNHSVASSHASSVSLGMSPTVTFSNRLKQRIFSPQSPIANFSLGHQFGAKISNYMSPSSPQSSEEQKASGSLINKIVHTFQSGVESVKYALVLLMTIAWALVMSVYVVLSSVVYTITLLLTSVVRVVRAPAQIGSIVSDTWKAMFHRQERHRRGEIIEKLSAYASRRNGAAKEISQYAARDYYRGLYDPVEEKQNSWVVFLIQCFVTAYLFYLLMTAFGGDIGMFNSVAAPVIVAEDGSISPEAIAATIQQALAAQYPQFKQQISREINAAIPNLRQTAQQEASKAAKSAVDNQRAEFQSTIAKQNAQQQQIEQLKQTLAKVEKQRQQQQQQQTSSSPAAQTATLSEEYIRIIETLQKESKDNNKHITQNTDQLKTLHDIIQSISSKPTSSETKESDTEQLHNAIYQKVMLQMASKLQEVEKATGDKIAKAVDPMDRAVEAVKSRIKELAKDIQQFQKENGDSLDNQSQELKAFVANKITSYDQKRKQEDKSKPVDQRLVNAVVSKVELTKQTGGISVETVRALVEQSIAKFEADTVGRTDFAMSSLGGHIVEHNTSTPFRVSSNSMVNFFFPKIDASYPAEVVLQPNTLPGNCFCFGGAQGQVTVALTFPIIPDAVTVDFVSEQIAVTTASAPKTVRVWGYRDEYDTQGTLMGEFVYKVNQGEQTRPAQTFALTNKMNTPAGIVRFEIMDNYGHDEFTCLYRVRVHGPLVEEE
eukprot:TRINITY_DN4067_c1_g1_i2.p1 TRINITY_DN4067_c1_g1~~TRINITY_DN4067_c1_g1_i2.p1  ORF type:complete len:893 (+),score=291.85 TRINITY_DN4067_c1_g1_i2:1271-3949(+)